MGRQSQKNEICDLILNELSDITQKKGVSFNDLFRRIKVKRGKFSFDTLSKYLNEMEQDSRKFSPDLNSLSDKKLVGIIILI